MRPTWRPVAVILTLAAAILTAPQAAAIPPCGESFSGGAGTAENPFRISTKVDLILLGLRPGCFDSEFIQTADISVDGGFASIGSDDYPFTGAYDGSSNTIDHLDVPLFGVVRGATIHGLTITGGLVSGQTITGAGALIEVLLWGAVSDITVNADVTPRTPAVIGDDRTIVAGGLVGIVGADGSLPATATIDNVTVHGHQIGDTGVGGIVGHVWGNASLTLTRAQVTGSVQGSYGVGGLIGYAGDGIFPVTVTDSSSSAMVTQSSLGSGWIGGLVGGAARAPGPLGDGMSTGQLLIERSSATGDVSAVKGSAGGLVGTCVGQCAISSSHATGDVTVTGVADLTEGIGGFVGRLAASSPSLIASSYATGDVSASLPSASAYKVENAGGFAGLIEDTEGGAAPLIELSAAYATGSVNVTAADTGATSSMIGGFAGRLSYVDLHDSHATGNVEASGLESIGGFVGLVDTDSVLRVVYATGDVDGGSYVGGFAGSVESSRIDQAEAAGAVNALVHGSGWAGGFAGVTHGSWIGYVFATGPVTSSGNYVGGIAGSTAGDTYQDSYAHGAVTGDWQVGGAFGENSSTVVSRVYATGRVTSGIGVEAFGGISGQADSPGFFDVYWDMQSTGQSSPGVADYSGESHTIPATGLTTTQMRSSSNFNPWDFDTVWGYLCSTSIYPQLRWADPSATQTSCPEPDNSGGGTPANTTPEDVSSPPDITAQGSVLATPPAPQPPGTASMTIGGQSVSLQATPQRRGQGISFGAGGMNFTMHSETGRGQSVPLSPDGSLVIARSGTLPTSGSGMAPGSFITQTLYSEPTVLGVTAVDANGNFSAAPAVPSSVPQGAHTLTLTGTTQGGEPFSFDLGVTVTSPAAAVGASPIVTFTPRVTSAGEIVRVTARQVQARCTVTFTLGTSRARTKASTQGVATARLRMPHGSPRQAILVASVTGKGCSSVAVQRSVGKKR